jgi:tetratricopeptide (TPR) repeat protein
MREMKTAADLCTIAIGLFERGFVRASLGTLARGTDQYPNSARIWELQGILLHSEQDFAGAEFALETATLLAPLSMAGQFALGACYLQTGHLSAAESIFEHLFNQPKLPPSRLGELAAGLARCGRLQHALAVCRKAAELEPDSDEAIYGMAHYMSRLEYPAEQVISLLERAVDLAPQVARYRLALVGWLARVGSFRRAHHHLQAVSREHLQTISCAGCLNRLLEVSRRAGDEPLQTLLTNRLEFAKKTSC